MSPTVRAASLRGFVPLVAELGGDPTAYLARFGIDPHALASDDEPVSITAHDLMLDAAAAELDCPDLGLRLARRRDVSVLGPLAVAISASATLRIALRVATRFLFVHSPALQIAVTDDPSGRSEVVAVVYRKDLRESQYSRQGIELGVGLMHAIALLLIDDRIGIRSVDFPHAPLSPIERYADYFGTEVRFGRPGPGDAHRTEPARSAATGG